jgi:hypothetical protein
MSYTNGPWAVNEDGWKVESEKEHGWVNDGWIICKLEGPDKEANARLIAAAPDLLAVARRILERGYVSEHLEEERGDHFLLATAIARAEGRSTPSSGIEGVWTPEEWREICAKAEKEAEAAGLKSDLSLFESQKAEIAILRKALQEILSDAMDPQERYDRNGPTWTTPEGHEYEDTSAFLAKCNEIAARARSALNESREGE